jgi:hypothetical protein
MRAPTLSAAASASRSVAAGFDGSSRSPDRAAELEERVHEADTSAAARHESLCETQIVLHAGLVPAAPLRAVRCRVPEVHQTAWPAPDVADQLTRLSEASETQRGEPGLRAQSGTPPG